MPHPPDDRPDDSSSVRTYLLQQATVIELHGVIDVWTAPAVRARLQHLAEPGAVLLIDLRPVTFFDCSGLEVLLEAHRWAVLGRGRLQVVCGDVRILSLMRTTRTRSLFQPAATLAEALAG
ncbi:STAS domain-containing protein [Streptomyces rimosus]|uniref:STAS domain-containing protein n=1 Tax=Streptomyces rimosus TaxID=1927 RepID=UPI00067C9606|nr:STAS domain-containing protein [Streptomyces rimosus]